MGQIIDGKAIAEKTRSELAASVSTYIEETGVRPKLVVILVGDDPASQIYVRSKEKACAEVGMAGDVHRISASVSQKELVDMVHKLNNDSSVHGILVQLPLPKHLDTITVLNEIDPAKDVDGLHPMNLGKLLKGEAGTFISCTPQGAMNLILSTGIDLRGKNAVVVGRSNIVGKPMAFLLLQQHATVTICHSRTQDLGAVCRSADILVAAVGRAQMIKGDWVKQGAVVIDVGINRLPPSEQYPKGKLVGDVDFEAAKDRAGFITPVPKGVGPMTIAMLLKNTLQAAKQLTA